MSFDRLAPYYTWMEMALAGRQLQHCRVAWLEALCGCNDILVAGVGHGHFLARCCRRYPNARITVVDASALMLRHAQSRARRAGAQMDRLQFVHAALPAWTPSAEAFDAIATHFFLDCFGPVELKTIVAALARATRSGASWLISDFAVPQGGLARHRATVVHALMYAFFRRVAKIHARAVTDPDALLRGHGFQLAGRKSAEWGLLRADCWRRDSRDAT